MAKHGLFPMFLFHFSVLNMDFSKLICQTWAFIIKKCMKCIVFMFFSKFWHMFSVLWDLQMHETCFLLAQHVISIIENCYFCFKWQNMLQHFFVSNVLFHFFSAEHGCLKINLPNMAVYQQKNAKHVSFSCKCLQFLQEKHVLWVSVHILWTLAMLHTNGFYWQFQVSYANHSGFLFWGIVL